MSFGGHHTIRQRCSSAINEDSGASFITELAKKKSRVHVNVLPVF